jgi:hypothetical protein
MYKYILCEFEYGYTGQFYQEIENGTVIRNTDLIGTTLVLENAYGAFVIDAEPTQPSWAS